MLRDRHDAEDAFQATFLVLFRKAGGLKSAGSLGSWLYRVAYRIALRANAVAARRRERPIEEVTMAAEAGSPGEAGTDLIARLSFRPPTQPDTCLVSEKSNEAALYHLTARPDETVNLGEIRLSRQPNR